MGRTRSRTISWTVRRTRQRREASRSTSFAIMEGDGEGGRGDVGEESWDSQSNCGLRE